MKNMLASSFVYVILDALHWLYVYVLKGVENSSYELLLIMVLLLVGQVVLSVLLFSNRWFKVSFRMNVG